jgi:hypothetical protein
MSHIDGKYIHFDEIMKNKCRLILIFARKRDNPKDYFSEDT